MKKPSDPCQNPTSGQTSPMKADWWVPSQPLSPVHHHAMELIFADERIHIPFPEAVAEVWDIPGDQDVNGYIFG